MRLEKRAATSDYFLVARPCDRDSADGALFRCSSSNLRAPIANRVGRMGRRKDLDTMITLAGTNDGILTRRSLLEAGLDRQVIGRRIRSGLLTRVLPGVFVFGSTSLSQRQLFRAALALAECPGHSEALCGYAAGEVREIVSPFVGRVSVATTRAKLSGVRVPLIPMAHGATGRITYRPTLSLDVEHCDGLPVTSVPRTLIEIGAIGGRRAIEKAWREADYRRILDLDAVRKEVQRTRRRGTPLLRTLLTTLPAPVDSAVDIRSRSEIAFLDLVAAAGLPAPLVNVRLEVGGNIYLADFYWPALRLVVEVDDSSHRQPVAMGRDRIRDVEFFIEDLDVMRFETHRLRSEPGVCMQQLAAGMARQRSRL
ncbi:MAG: DUF559 domain-containing protein, partial [Solirubrobacteraceae bacterium]